MANATSKGLHRVTCSRTGTVWPTLHVRRDVPKDVRTRIGKSVFVATTGTTHEGDAKIVRDRLWRQWDAEIAEARALGDGPVVTLENALAAIEAWRWRRCRIASGVAGADEMARVGVAALFPGADLGSVTSPDTPPTTISVCRATPTRAARSKPRPPSRC